MIENDKYKLLSEGIGLGNITLFTMNNEMKE